MEAVAAAMVDLNTLSRRELQALCKLNGVRANMTNLAMVEALQSLPSVDGIDQVGTTLCLPTPGKSAMKSVLRTAPASDQQQQQQGSPLPRGRRVSVKSPEAIRMDAEEEEDETKRDFIREIVRTPGVALRSTSRRARATPAPLPTPAAGTLRRSQRSTVRKATAPVEEVEASTAKRSTRKTARPMVMIDLDQEEEDKVQQVEPKAATSDEKCEGLEEEEVAKLPEEGNSKEDEPEQGPAIGEEEKLVNAEKSAPLSVMECSPILGVLSMAAPEPAMKNVENASTEDRKVFGTWSPVLEIADEINSASEDKEVVPEEAVKEDAFNCTVEAAAAPNKMVTAVVTEKEVPVDELLQADLKDDESAEKYDPVGESSEEADLTEESSVVDDIDDDEDMLKADQTVDEESDETIESAASLNNMVPAAVTEKKIAVDEVPQADLTEDESAEEYDLDVESSEEDDLTEESCEVDYLDEEGEDMLKAEQTVDEESDYTIEMSGSIDVNFDSDEEEEQLKMLETGEETKEVEDSDSLTGEEDDFSTDLSSEFDDLANFSDAETGSDSSPVALEGIIDAAAAASSAAKTVESVITEEAEVSCEGDLVSQHVETIVKSLDEVTITEEKKEECTKEKQQLKVGKEMSLRKLKSAYKESLIAAKEGKKLTIASEEGSRVAFAVLDDNAEC